MRNFQKAVSHATIILAGMFITLSILDRGHPAMHFLNNAISRVLLCLLSIFALVHAIVNLIHIRQRENAEEEPDTHFWDDYIPVPNNYNDEGTPSSKAS